MAGQGARERHRVLGPDPATHWRWKRGTGVWRLRLVTCHPRPLGTRRKWKLLTGPGASGGTEQKGNKRFSTRPSSGERSGAVTISWRAGSRGTGSPVSGTPPALALHGLGRGGGRLRRFLAASSTLWPLWKLLLWPSWSRGGGSRRALSAMSRWRGCSQR